MLRCHLLIIFSFAVPDIMHINKQRLIATEEVKRLKTENESLLEKLEQSEDEMKRTLIECEGALI